MEWKPIETAPRDGTWIADITREGGEEHAPCVACYHKGKWMEMGHYVAGCVDYDEWNLTHWSPLPKPPSKQ